MNRNQEFSQWMTELEGNLPDLQPSLDKAFRRRRARQRWQRPLVSAAACFAAFVFLVNCSPPVSSACARIPILRELAAAVTFSPSLSQAVEHEYLQPLALTQTQDGVTAQVEYLIVDQKQVNIFFRLDSEEGIPLEADPEIRFSEGGEQGGISYSVNSFGVENGELRSLTVDFVERNVPDSLEMTLKVYQRDKPMEHAGEQSPPTISTSQWELPPEPEYLTELTFHLEFDPTFTASGRVVPVGESLMLDGQRIMVTQLEIYPTHLRIQVEEAPENTAWLKSLEFYLEAENGDRYYPVKNGISATGTLNSPAITSYRAESSYFSQAQRLTLVVTGAKWLRKDLEKTQINLKTGETGKLPPGVEFVSAQRQGNDWTLTFRAEYREGEPMYQLFENGYYDPSGNRYEINAWISQYEDAPDGKITHFLEQFPLREYAEDVVWITPYFSSQWSGESSLVITGLQGDGE